MKFVIGGLLLVCLIVTGYFVFNPGEAPAKPVPVRVSENNPFLKAAPVDIPFNTDKADHAKKLFTDGRYQDAVSISGSIYASGASHQAKASALLLGAQALMQINDAASRRYARELYELYGEQFSKEGNADTALYNLGLIDMTEGNGPAALLHFTSMLQEYPDSRFAPNASFFARQIATVIERQNETLKGRVLRRIGPFLPSNTTALVGILTSLASVIVWFAYDWQGHYHKLIVEKDPLVWTLLILLVALATTNYLFEDQQNAKTMLDATKALSALKR